MTPEKFHKITKRRLIHSYGSIVSAAKNLGISRDKLSQGINGTRKMPKEVLSFMGYEMNKEPVVITYTRVKN